MPVSCLLPSPFVVLLADLVWNHSVAHILHHLVRIMQVRMQCSLYWECASMHLPYPYTYVCRTLPVCQPHTDWWLPKPLTKPLHPSPGEAMSCDVPVASGARTGGVQQSQLSHISLKGLCFSVDISRVLGPETEGST